LEQEAANIHSGHTNPGLLLLATTLRAKRCCVAGYDSIHDFWTIAEKTGSAISTRLAACPGGKASVPLGEE
jgi:hypothetical protein